MQKEVCMLYFLNPIDIDFEHEIIGLLEEEGYEFTVMKSVMEFKSWERLANKKVPSLLITDLSNHDETFAQILGNLEFATIMCVNERFSSGEIKIGSNKVLTFSAYEDVLELFSEENSFIRNDLSHLNQQETNIPNASIQTGQKRSNNGDEGTPLTTTQDFPEDVDPFMEPHPSIKMITEFNKETVSGLHSRLAQSEQGGHMESENPASNEESSCRPQQDLKPELSLPMRPREIQQQLFSHRQRESHRSIGIWSPIHRTGVTSLTINFAIFLARQKYDVTVLEGLTNDYSMKDWLKRYVAIPQDWYSYAKAIQKDVDASHAIWIYENIMFLPLDKDDPQYEWDKDSLKSYMNTTKLSDVTLIDLPTGEMKPYTKNSLQYLDQLWIVVDDSIQETLAWSEYMTALKKDVSCPIFLVFNKHYPFSQSREVGKNLKIPVIACIPSLHEETMRNYYETVPLYLLEGLKERFDESFSALAKNLFDGNFRFVEKGVDIPQTNWREKLFKPIRTLLKPLKNN